MAERPFTVIEHAAVSNPPRSLHLQHYHLGTPRLAKNDAGVIQWRWDSDGYGTNAPTQDPDGDGKATVINLRFPGQYYDQESGLYYNWNRYYSPRLGRYLSPDPIGIEGGANGYAYVDGNPLGCIDPTGEVGLRGAGIGGVFELGIQALKNYRAGCRVLDPSNYNWYDVGVAAAVGAVAPGWLAVGKNTANSGRAIASLSKQPGRARTVNRASKIAGRIQDHTAGIANDLITQLAF